MVNRYWKASLSTYFLLFMREQLNIMIDRVCLERYTDFYFKKHPRAKNPPIKSPQHPSINAYTRMTFQAANNLKQKWKAFIVWLIDDLGYSGKMIEQCEMVYRTYFAQNRRHDLDNLSPKYILDGFVEAGLLVDDNSDHITKLVIECGLDKENPRIEFLITVM